MRNLSIFRKSMIAAGVVVAIAAVPFSQAMAQQSASSSAMASTSNQTVPGKVDDSWITTKVKSQLASAKGVKSTDISVTTTEGVVALSGTVASAKQKTHVEHIAKKVKGVKSVDGTALTIAAAAPASSSSSAH